VGARKQGEAVESNGEGTARIRAGTNAMEVEVKTIHFSATMRI
jgi:hypothetical protein